MDQSQLVELVKTLNSEERDQILSFAAIPFFNNGRMRAHVGPLINICLKHTWHDTTKKLEKADVYASLFPGQTFVDGKIEKVMVEAQKFIRNFLLTLNYFRDENEFYQIFDYSNILRVKGLNSRYQLTLARLKKMQNESPWNNSRHFHQQFLLEGAIHYQECLDNQSKGDLNIPNLLHAIEIHYYLRRVELLNRYLLQLLVTKLDVPESIQQYIKENIVPERYLKESPSLKINFEIYNILKKRLPDTYDIRLLFDLLLSHEKNLDRETLQEFYSYLRNFSTLILNADVYMDEFRRTLHELYIDNLARGYLHYEGKISPARYLAVSNNAIKIKQFEWANEFIESHKHEIYGENETRDIYRFNKAHYLFAIGKYSECLDFIPATSPFINYFLNGKRLELKAHYELQSDLLPYKLDAFKMYLSRTSQKILADNQRQPNIDFANLLAQLIVSIPGDNPRVERLLRRLEEKKQAAEWLWLHAKALTLKGK